MPESLQIYRTALGLLLSASVRFHDIRCQAAFIWAVTGLILEQGMLVRHLMRTGYGRGGAGAGGVGDCRVCLGT